MEKNYSMSSKEFTNNLAFLSPALTIKIEHLNKKDVRRIKRSLGFKVASISLVVAIMTLLINVVLTIIMGLNSNFKIIETYGIYGFIGMVVSVFAAIINIVTISLSYRHTNIKIKKTLCHIGLNTLFVGIVAQMLLSFYSDAAMGYLTSSESVSPAILLAAILFIIQPVLWSEALTLDLLASIGLIVVSIICQYKFDAKAIYYNIVSAVVLLLISYLVVSILFYAETQRYCQVKRNERLYNTAMYDELTRCKNRHALREFLKENQKRWETRTGNILLIMFDIDNFKEYNDQFSHPGGDFVLRKVSDSIRREFQSPDLDFYRYGGEEFLLFFEIKNQSDANSIIINVKNSISGLHIEAPEGAPKEMVTVSVGGTVIATPIEFNFNEALATVDKYLYEAKKSGKDVCCLDGKILK